MNEENQTFTNLEIPSRWKRFFAYILDLIINLTIIGLIVNIIVIFVAKTTLGNMLVGINIVDNDDRNLKLGIALLRFGFFYSTIYILLFLIFQNVSSFFCLPFGIGRDYICIPDYDSIAYRIIRIYSIFIKFISIVFIINIIELFFKCPTFIDRRLGIKRFYKKSKKNNE